MRMQNMVGNMQNGYCSANVPPTPGLIDGK